MFCYTGVVEENKAEMMPERKEFGPELRDVFFRVLRKDLRIQEMWDKLQEPLRNLCEVDDGETVGHSIRVAKIAVNIFDFMSLTAKFFGRRFDKAKIGELRDLVFLSALLHDVGKGTETEEGGLKYRKILNSKIVIPPEQRQVMDQAGDSSSENKNNVPDWVSFMAQHAEDGAKILKEIGLPDAIVRVARDHHKKGQGALRHLPTEIIALADVLDASTSKGRAYNTAPLTKLEAFNYTAGFILNRLAGHRIKEVFERWKPEYTRNTLPA